VLPPLNTPMMSLFASEFAERSEASEDLFCTEVGDWKYPPMVLVETPSQINPDCCKIFQFSESNCQVKYYYGLANHAMMINFQFDFSING